MFLEIAPSAPSGETSAADAVPAVIPRHQCANGYRGGMDIQISFSSRLGYVECKVFIFSYNDDERDHVEG